jgi:hypothetical protein
MNWRGCRRKQSWHILRGNFHSICPEGLGKYQKITFRIKAEIWSQVFQNRVMSAIYYHDAECRCRHIMLTETQCILDLWHELWIHVLSPMFIILLEDEDVLICCDIFRMNQMNVWVPYTAHIHLKVLLVRRTLSLLWWRMNKRMMTHTVNKVSVCQIHKFQAGKYKRCAVYGLIMVNNLTSKILPFLYSCDFEIFV